MLALHCTPSPGLIVVGQAESALEKEFERLFSIDVGQALIVLATDRLRIEIEPSLAWLRHWAQRFMARLCQTRELTKVLVPDAIIREAVLAAVPPMVGAEYLTDDLLVALWSAMTAYIERVASDDLEGWLKSTGEVWHLVGRVTFHLAENKRDEQRPFAFLATFTEKLSSSGKLQHLPLARAVQNYAQQGDQAALTALLEPVRTAAMRSEWVKSLLESKQLFQALGWTPVEAYRLVHDLEVLRESGIVTKVPDWWSGGRPSRPIVQVTIDAPQKSSLGVSAMLSFSVALSMDGEVLTADEIAKIKASQSSLVTLRGKWVEIDREQLDHVLLHWTRVQALHANGAMSFHQGMRYLSGLGAPVASASLAGFADTSITWSEVIAGSRLQAMLDQCREPEDAAPPHGLHATMRPYQAKGLAWLNFMQRLGLGACLADDMGLGKTLQIIALLLSIRGQGGVSLILAPASLIGNWRAEFEKFAPSLRVFAAHASATSRELLDTLESDAEAVLADVDAVITTYQNIVRSDALRAHRWNLVILDEAQAIKTPGTAQTKAVKCLHARARVALTGTPVENRPGDLWSIFDFLNPGLLGSAADFADTIKRLGNNFAPLRKLVKPYLLRRMKTDRSIIADLPEKIEMKAQCPLTKKQATIYTRLVQELRRTLDDPSLAPFKRNGLVLSFLIKFKQVCNHPSHWSGDGQFKPEDSGKFLRLEEICSELAQRQERALIFTQFQEMCDPLAQHLSQVFGRPGLVLHGGTPVARRSEMVDQFQSPDGPPFFVISVKAGGTGLTLTAASHVIHFDRWWNPAVENQATDRAFRIGQKRNVLVHKFVVPGTLEERVDRLIDDKKWLANELLSGSGGEQSLINMSNDELLRFVALDVSSVA